MQAIRSLAKVAVKAVATTVFAEYEPFITGLIQSVRGPIGDFWIRGPPPATVY